MIRLPSFAILCLVLSLAFLGLARAESHLSWHYSYQDALAEAKRTNKPLFLEFRCAPCVNGREFDAKVLFTDPESSRGGLLQQYVRARVTTMTGVDIGHFDRDWHNSLYYFVINANEDIYLRYGGRDEESATTYLNLESLELALQQGLDEHEKFLAGNRPSAQRKAKRVPEDYPLLKKNVTSTGRCTECHLIGDYTSQQKALAGVLNPIKDLYQSPDIKTLGIELDIPKGLKVAKTQGASARAGLFANDTITAINGQEVLTFGDLQYHYDKTPRTAQTIQLSVQRGMINKILTIQLPKEWWKTDLSFRHWSLETQLYFKASTLGFDEKKRLGLPKEGFASEITQVDFEAFLEERHSLQVGDIITAVDGRTLDPRTMDLHTHVQLCHSAGKDISITVVRDGRKFAATVKTGRKAFRKAADKVINAIESDIHWSAKQSIYKGSEAVVDYRASIANGHLLIEVQHRAGWHTYAMDNPQRAIELNGKLGDQDLPTKIELGSQLLAAGPWLQSKPNDYSKPELHWHTWGFEGTSYFALPLKKEPSTMTSLKISSQACTSESCAGTFGLEIQVPMPSSHRSPVVEDILDQLDAVLE